LANSEQIISTLTLALAAGRSVAEHDVDSSPLWPLVVSAVTGAIDLEESTTVDVEKYNDDPLARSVAALIESGSGADELEGSNASSLKLWVNAGGHHSTVVTTAAVAAASTHCKKSIKADQTMFETATRCRLHRY
jgi:hypothetical protein